MVMDTGTAPHTPVVDVVVRFAGASMCRTRRHHPEPRDNVFEVIQSPAQQLSVGAHLRFTFCAPVTSGTSQRYAGQIVVLDRVLAFDHHITVFKGQPPEDGAPGHPGIVQVKVPNSWVVNNLTWDGYYD